MSTVLVVGSINMDLVVEASRFPGPGETVLGSAYRSFPGGKGANQAVAARRLGACVRLVGCVGDDAFGRELLDHLCAEGIDTRWVRVAGEVRTGVASITVSAAENSIVVVPGANHALTADDVRAAEEAIAGADVVLVQLEIPLETVETVAELAEKHAKPLILNPAPATPLPIRLLRRVTLLTPNEHELAVVFPEYGRGWQRTLGAMPGRIVMTHGAEGAWFSDADGRLHQQSGFRVEALDTTGAGDTFNGALAAFWDREPHDRIRLACAAGALSVTRHGAQAGMPTRNELLEFLARN